MSRDSVSKHPIRIVFNYWESRPSAVGDRLDALSDEGIHGLLSFVPWQAFEADISHSLMRYLQAAAERKISVTLILSPEMGVHYRNSGIPKDLFGRADNLASSSDGEAIPVVLPPNVFYLPSLFADDIVKRYQSYLSRVQGFLGDLQRNSPEVLQRVDLVLTGSFWKYYRSPKDCTFDFFAGTAGDRSKNASMVYRRRVDEFYSKEEFSQPSPSAANRWKTRSYDEVNRGWFYQNCEERFRESSTEILSRRGMTSEMLQMELFTPEADPGLVYSTVLQNLAGGVGDFFRLSECLDEMASRETGVSGQLTAPYVHWTGFGSFSRLTDAEKQFLLLKSLLLMGGRGGGILVDEREWLGLSGSFRMKAEQLGRSLQEKKLALRNRLLYLAPHLWSATGPLWQEFRHQVGAEARMTATLDLFLNDREAVLGVVDPSMILTQERLEKLIRWCEDGRVLVIPRGPLMTHWAKDSLQEMEKVVPSGVSRSGISFECRGMGNGTLFLYDLPDGVLEKNELMIAWREFTQLLLKEAGIQGVCQISDGRMGAIPMVREMPHGHGVGLFVLNGTGRAVTADLHFPLPVSVSDLALSFSDRSSHQENLSEPARRFSLDVPPCGILPLAVEGLSLEGEERLEAALASEATRRSALDAATSQLPGFDPEKDLWS